MPLVESAPAPGLYQDVDLMAGPEHSLLREKLDAIGFGFFVPIFFIMVGVEFDLFVLFGSLLMLGIHAESGAGSVTRSWLARTAALAFCAVCIGYDLACSQMNLLSGRGFLFGFVAAWPIARPAVAALYQHTELGRGLLLSLAAFAVYFWSSALCFALRAGWSMARSI